MLTESYTRCKYYTLCGFKSRHSDHIVTPRAATVLGVFLVFATVAGISHIQHFEVPFISLTLLFNFLQVKMLTKMLTDIISRAGDFSPALFYTQCFTTYSKYAPALSFTASLSLIHAEAIST